MVVADFARAISLALTKTWAPQEGNDWWQALVITPPKLGERKFYPARWHAAVVALDDACAH